MTKVKPNNTEIHQRGFFFWNIMKKENEEKIWNKIKTLKASIKIFFFLNTKKLFLWFRHWGIIHRGHTYIYTSNFLLHKNNLINYFVCHLLINHIKKISGWNRECDFVIIFFSFNSNLRNYVVVSNCNMIQKIAR